MALLLRAAGKTVHDPLRIHYVTCDAPRSILAQNFVEEGNFVTSLLKKITVILATMLHQWYHASQSRW